MGNQSGSESDFLLLVTALHRDVERLHDGSSAAVTEWITTQAQRSQSFAAWDRAAADYRSLDQIFQLLATLVTDVTDEMASLPSSDAATLIQGVREQIGSINSTAVPVGDDLRRALEILDEYHHQVVRRYRDLESPVPDSSNISQSVSTARVLIESIMTAEARRDLARFRDDIHQVARSVSETASNQLSIDFRLWADREQRRADQFRWLALACLLVAFAISCGILFMAHFSWSTDLAKLAIQLPLFLAAYYFSSESRDHRLNSTRAREIEVRLNTIRAYTDDLDRSDRDALRIALGRAIFRDPVVLAKGRALGDLSSSIASDVAEMLAASRSAGGP